jgi:WD40 repeat protein
VATSSYDNQIKVWDTTSASNWILIRNFTHSDEVIGMDWVDKDLIASAPYNNCPYIFIWNISTGLVVNNKTNTNNKIVSSLKLLNNKIHLAVAFGYNNDYNISIFNINDGSLVASLKGHTSYPWDIVQLDDNRLASSALNNKILIWDLTTYSLNSTLTNHTDAVWGMKLITPGIFASGSADKSIKLWDSTSLAEIRTLANHTRAIVFGVDLLNAQTLISGAYDKSIKLWDWSSGELLNTIDANVSINALTVLRNP